MRLTRLLLAAGKDASKKSKNPDSWKWHVSGLTGAEMKKHYAIIPINIFTAGALIMAGAYIYRLATRHPEVSWTKQNSEPWEEYRNKQYKFVNPGRDYSKGTVAPDIRNK